VAVWVVIGLLAGGAVVATVAARRHTHDVEPTVREFAEFRDAISRQVLGVRSDTHTAHAHLELHVGGRSAPQAGDPGGDRRRRS
jgi:hypothetical protein